ncbi:MAG: sigma-54-dependent transcriptional regulator [Rhodothermaceae bacterium]
MLRNHRILIVDDDETLCYLLKEELIDEGFIVDIVYDGNAAVEKLKGSSYHLLLLDLEMKETSGEDVLAYVTENVSDLQVIVLTAKAGTRTAIECIKNGAFDFISKPYEFGQLLNTIERALDHQQVVADNRVLGSETGQTKTSKIIGKSKPISRILELAEKAAKSNSNILLEGETGTGKELFSEFIHAHSQRSDKPFVAINCASLPDQLIESELFGYEKGAFTDAKNSKQGLVEIANGGTLFLDEIGEMSLALQPKLLRFLENGEFRRVGGINNLSSNVRIIAATNRNLFEESDRKKFRRDLLFRLNVITLSIPPLRDRGEDILLLAEYFLKIKSGSNQVKVLAEETKDALKAYAYPGNVRELHHIIERALIFADGNVIRPKDLNLPDHFVESKEEHLDDSGELISLDDMEKDHIKFALDHFNWNRDNTARALGISQKTLYSKIKKYNLK